MIRRTDEGSTEKKKKDKKNITSIKSTE